MTMNSAEQGFADSLLGRLQQQMEAKDAEIDRLNVLLRTATKAMFCCTIVGLGKEIKPDSEFAKGVLHAVEAVNNNIWSDLRAPDGKRSYMWWERQIDPNVKFVDGEGNEIPYPSRDRDTDAKD
jgi:hypothetical protein